MKVYNKQMTGSMNEQLKEKLTMMRDKRNFNAQSYIENKIELLNQYMRHCRLKSCVVAISGGVDSAVVLGLIAKAAQAKDSPIERIIPLALPLFDSTGVTNQETATKKGEALCKAFHVKPIVLDLSAINKAIRDLLEPAIGITGDDWAIGQLGPYSRTPILYYATSLLTKSGSNGFVCGTTNLSEGGYLGYVGKASDGMVDVQMISDIYKSEVLEVAKALGVPDEIIKATPTGDMYDNRADEEVFGAPYDFVELYHYYLNYTDEEKALFLKSLKPEAYNQFVFYQENLENLHNYNKHKYVSKSQAIHLDLWDSSIKGGWCNHYAITQAYLKEGKIIHG